MNRTNLLPLALAGCLQASAAGRHIIVAYAPNLPDAVRQEIAGVAGTALYQSDSGTRITVVRTDPLATIADLTVPDGSPVLRQRRAAPSIARTVRELNATTNSLGQFLVPSILDAVGRQWASQNDTVILVGPALHTDARQPEFNFTTNWPSDGHLVADAARSPFSTLDRRQILNGVGVYWIVTDADRMANTRQAKAVQRFWELYVAMQGGTLVNFSPDVTSTFGNAAAGRLSTGSVPALDPHDNVVMMHPGGRPVPLSSGPAFPTPIYITNVVTNIVVQTTIVTVTNELKVLRETEIPRVAAGNTGIGIVWFVAPGESQRLDLDLYVWVPRDGVELFYRNPVSRSGRYFRDVRQASGSAQSEWRASYEFVELQGDQIPPEIWINVYAGKGPAQGELRVQHGGKEYRIAFVIPAVRGNEGNDRNGRSKNEHWLKIDLLPLLQAP